MIQRLLEDRMLLLAFRRAWLRVGEGDQGLQEQMEWAPGEALSRLFREGRLSPAQMKTLEEDARQEMRLWQDLTHDELPREATTPETQGPSGPRSAASGEHRLWARLAGISDGEPWGPYRLLHLLGEGGMGRVYKAMDPLLGRPVALKILQRTGGKNLERFFNEARAQARVEHKNVAKVFGVGEAEGLPFISMQYVDGITLKEASGSLPLEQKVRIMVQVCEGVHAAHRLGIIHRDLKPGNVMIERTPEGIWHPLVLDFGLAFLPEATALTQAGQTVGTPQYMSPEQARGQPLDRRSDVYALGVTLFEFICGRPPFEGDQPLDILRRAAEQEPPSPRSLSPGVPKDLETIILKALEKSPDRRYDSAKALGEDLQHYLDGEPIFARPASRTELLVKWVRRHRVFAGVVGASAVTLLLVGGFSAVALIRNKAQAREGQRFSQESDRLESLLFKAYTLPPHDVQPVEDEARSKLAKLAKEVESLGHDAEGPGHLALGRTYMALGDIDEAHAELQRSWDSGYRSPELLEAFGLAKAGLYRALLADVTGPDREERLKELEGTLRLPALDLLRRAQASSKGLPDLAAAELALTEGRYQDALNLSRQAREAQPWLYQAHLLDAEICFAQASTPMASGDYTNAAEHVEAAEEHISKAREVARSAPAVYEMEARHRAEVIHLHMVTSTSRPEDLMWAKAACEDALFIRPDSWKAYGSLANIFLQWSSQAEGWRQDSRPFTQEGIHAAEKALALNPESNEVLSTLAYLWWRQAHLEEMAGQDPRRALARTVEALEKALRNPAQAATLHQRMGNCYTTQGFFELNSGENPEPAVEAAERQYEESVRLKPSGQVLSDHIWALGIRARADLLKGMDPLPTLLAASKLFAESRRLTPNYFFASTNLADICILRAEYLEDRGQDPSPEVARAEELAREALKTKSGLRYALPDLGQAALIRARWKLRKGADPSPDLAAARNYFKEGRHQELVQSWPQRGLLLCQLEELRARGTVDRAAFRRLESEAQKLAGAHAKDPFVLRLLARIQNRGAAPPGFGMARENPPPEDPHGS